MRIANRTSRFPSTTGPLAAIALVLLLVACGSSGHGAASGTTTTTARHSGGGSAGRDRDHQTTTASSASRADAAARDGSNPTTPPTAASGRGAVTLAADLPFSAAGLQCSEIDGTTFVQHGSPNTEHFSLSYDRHGTANSGGLLTWGTDAQHGAISGGEMNPMTITLNPDGTSGTFEGEAIIAIAGQQPSRTNFTGTFDCP